MAFALEQATGQHFWVAESGRQFGSDAVSEVGYANRIRVEVKQYSDRTRLSLSSLRDKLQEAAQRDQDLDVWALATTAQASAQLEEGLALSADQIGIDLLILDCSHSDLPRLLTLMAISRAAVIDWANRNCPTVNKKNLATELDAIAAHPAFEQTKRALLRKLEGLSGYEIARRRSQSRIVAVLSDVVQAKTVFGQSLAVRAPGTRLVSRAALHSSLDNWWASSESPPPAVVLGEEGTGKSWAVVDWLARRIGAGAMPIVLPVAACNATLSSQDDPTDLLSRMLEKWTQLRDESWWKRKLRRWHGQNCEHRPWLLLFIDGLNERAALEWRAILGRFGGEPWGNRLAILATDRTHHWQSRCSMVGLITFEVFTIGAYSPSELDEALYGSQVSWSNVPPGLRDLISVPRYCHLVVAHYAEMVAAGDFTRDRLIYLELRDRFASKLHYPLSESQLSDLVRTLARRATANAQLHGSDLRPIISASFGNDPNIYEEIAGGGFLVEAPVLGTTISYRVEPRRLVYGFGMLLAEELYGNSFTTTAEVEEWLSSQLEPQPDIDRKVEICGSALFHAVCTDDFPEVRLQGLISYWLGLRNWPDTAHLAVVGYVRRRPDAFIASADRFWSNQDDNSAAQEILRQAFVENRDHPVVRPRLVAAVERWMGFVHPLGRRFQDLERTHSSEVPAGDSDKEDDKREVTRREIESRAGCPLVPGQISVCGVDLTVVNDGLSLRLARFGLLIMSAGHVRPYAGPLVHWAVASAVMGLSDFEDLIHWVVRFSDPDSHEFLMGKARALLDRPEPAASVAAGYLLRSIGSLESKRLVEDHGLIPRWWADQMKLHAIDPCKSFFPWAVHEILPCLGRSDVPLHIILDRSKELVADPSVELPQSLIVRARQALSSIDPRGIRASASQTTESLECDRLKAVLCARDPSAFAVFERSVIRTLPARELNGQYYLAFVLPELSLLLDADAASAISEALDKWRETLAGLLLNPDDANTGRREAICEARAFNAMGPYLGPIEYFRQLVSRPCRCEDHCTFELWLGRVTETEVTAALEILHQPTSRASLLRVIWAMPHLGVTLSERDRSRLLELARSSDEAMRAAVMRLAALLGVPDFAQQIVDLGAAIRKDTGAFEAQWTAELLLQFDGTMAFEDLAARLPHYCLSYAIVRRGNQDIEVRALGEALNTTFSNVVEAEEPTIKGLPQVRTRATEHATGAEFPTLAEEEQNPVMRLDPLSSWTSGSLRNNSAKLRELFALDDDIDVVNKRLNRDLKLKRDAIVAAWDTTAFQWFGRTFSAEFMEQLHRRCPSIVRRWAERAIKDSIGGATLRSRIGSFLEPVCRVLLNGDPELGLRLWKVLHERDAGSYRFDTMESAFSAEDSLQVNEARDTIVEEAWNDAALCRIAVTCLKWDRQDWLADAIENLIASGLPWRKAKGLALASFSNIESSIFENLVSKAEVSGTWVEGTLDYLRENVRRNVLARQWYSWFLSCEDRDSAWAALQLVLLLADERITAWKHEIERTRENQALVEERLKYLTLAFSRRDMMNRVSREKARKEKLFGFKIGRGEIWPFLD